MLNRHALVLTATITVLCATLLGQGRHPVSGRQIAGVMGHQGASWLERPEREKEEAPTKAIAALNIKPGQTVADIGAGSGYYSVLLAGAVGPTGRVFATDIQPEMLALIKKKLDALPIPQIQLVSAPRRSRGFRTARSIWR